MRIAHLAAAAGTVLVASLPRSPAPRAEHAVPNDNRAAAGTLRAGVLAVHLEVREAEWLPEGEGKPSIHVYAFAERGKPATVPGPMIRVPEGTEVRATVTNTLAQPLVVHGLTTKGEHRPDSLPLAPGATGEVRYRAGLPGTYYYVGRVATPAGQQGGTSSALLSGAVVVDPRGTPARANDRVLLISLWSAGPLPGGAVGRGDVVRFAVNGRSWPNTERLSYAVGDTVRFRLINATGAVHPMHLHGFYFDVTARGDWGVDSLLAGAAAPRVVTERLDAGRTFAMTWVPDRAGNWLFHCHDNLHVLRNRPLDGSALPPEHHVHTTDHTRDMMGGLVMAIAVRGGKVAAKPDARAPRRLRLVAQVDPAGAGTDAEPAYGYALEEAGRSAPAGGPLLPGPTILLKRGDPVSITVVNRLSEPTSVHWHGMELESYFDGVADYSGAGSHVAKAIAPGDSFVARFTPPRSGTFMYHPHADELRQQQAGLSGALLVVDDPAAFDAAHDKLVLLTSTRGGDAPGTLINGSSAPAPLELRAGERYRLRIVNVHTFRASMIVRVQRDSSAASLATWRALAKDGMDLPPAQATARPARQQLGTGEAYDFELAPTAPGDLRLTVTTGNNLPLAELTLRVR